MKIRNKITLWIAGTALLAAMGFSGFVFRTLVDEPYKFIDLELQQVADLVFRDFAAAGREARTEVTVPFGADRYWIRLLDDRGATLFASTLTRYVELPLPARQTTYNLERVVPRQLVEMGQDEDDEVFFRVRVLRRVVDTRQFSMVIAKPIETFEEEVEGLARQISAALAIFTLLVVIGSYLLAGRILRPIIRINRMVREITDSSLDQRIPLPGNKDELHALTLSLNRMFDRLQLSFARQKEFVSNAAHELKSPLTLLLLSQEELINRAGDGGALPDGLIRQADTVRRMGRLVKNLLDLSRLEHQDNLCYREVDLGQLIQRVLSEYEAIFQAGNIVIETGIAVPCHIRGDREKLQRLFVNLLDNAWRYNLKSGGTIRIETRRNNGSVIIRVANTGPGVPPEETERVFDQFYRLEKSRSSASGGSGLGLTIARKIVQLHDGTIELASTPGKWTTVTVVLSAHLPER